MAYLLGSDKNVTLSGERHVAQGRKPITYQHATGVIKNVTTSDERHVA